MPNSPLLSLKDVTKRFGKFTAVDNASFQVRPGEVIGFLGPNGAGKTTTIRMILGQLSMTEGAIKLFGQPVSLASNNLHQDIGFLGSDMAYEEGLTVNQFLQFVDAVRGGGSGNRIKQLSERLELDLSRKIRQLSRGNRQKIGLVAAVMHQPKLLIMDEPTSGFDPLMQQVFAEIITEHTSAGGGVLISSHVLSEVQHLCERVLFIRTGKILGEQSIKELLSTSPREVELHFTNSTLATRAIKQLVALPGWTSQTSTRSIVDGTYQGPIPELLTILAKLKPQQCSIREPELEEVFMRFYEPEKDTSEEVVA